MEQEPGWRHRPPWLVREELNNIFNKKSAALVGLRIFIYESCLISSLSLKEGGQNKETANT